MSLVHSTQLMYTIISPYHFSVKPLQFGHNVISLVYTSNSKNAFYTEEKETEMFRVSNSSARVYII